MKISVVVRSRDKEKHFERVFQILSLQSLLPTEIIVVNNFSSKKSLRVLRESLTRCADELKKMGVRIRLALISDQDFSHSYSTNLGICISENEIVCVTNGHSLPVSFSWLEDGVRHFKNKKVACVSGFFYPHQNTCRFRRISMAAYYLTENSIMKMRWGSTMNCMIRKALWNKYPFNEDLPKAIPETRVYGLEDYDWSLEMAARGFEIVIDPRFSIYHSHESGLNEIKRHMKDFFVHTKIRKKLRQLKRPRESFSRARQVSPIFAEDI